ncbi:hypothetical protein PFISCL1PPCAC_26948, partial [Pristionchus fissidentatus]
DVTEGHEHEVDAEDIHDLVHIDDETHVIHGEEDPNIPVAVPVLRGNRFGCHGHHHDHDHDDHHDHHHHHDDHLGHHHGHHWHTPCNCSAAFKKGYAVGYERGFAHGHAAGLPVGKAQGYPAGFEQ